MSAVYIQAGLNNPPYIVTDVFTEIVATVSAELETPVYSHFGYVNELNETLIQYNESPALFDKKFPLVWLAQPFTITHGKNVGLFGEIDELRLFIIKDTDKNWKATERMENNYKPVIYPIYRELVRQLVRSKKFAWYPAPDTYKITDRYYWGESQGNVLIDNVDIMELRISNVKIHNNKNCLN